MPNAEQFQMLQRKIHVLEAMVTELRAKAKRADELLRKMYFAASNQEDLVAMNDYFSGIYTDREKS